MLFPVGNSFYIDLAIDKEFQIDDTAMATRQITKKLDQLEHIVKRGPQTNKLREKIMRQSTLVSISSKVVDEGGFTKSNASSRKASGIAGRYTDNSIACSIPTCSISHSESTLSQFPNSETKNSSKSKFNF